MRTKIQNITKQSTRTEKNSKKEQQNNYIIDNNKMQGRKCTYDPYQANNSNTLQNNNALNDRLIKDN